MTSYTETSPNRTLEAEPVPPPRPRRGGFLRDLMRHRGGMFGAESDRVLFVVKEDVAANPLDIGLLSSVRVMLHPQQVGYLVEQFSRSWLHCSDFPNALIRDLRQTNAGSPVEKMKKYGSFQAKILIEGYYAEIVAG